MTTWILWGTARAVYDFICEYKEQHDGIAPTELELAEALHMHRNTARYHITMLHMHGFITVYAPNRRQRGIIVRGGRWLRPSPEGQYDDRENTEV